MKRVIKISEKSAQPKYRQIIESIYRSIENGSLSKGDKVPSINQICAGYNLCRDTVLLAFRELKSRGILKSQPGKGYYIATAEAHRDDEKVFILFDEMNAFKEDLYNSLVNTLKGKAKVDIYFHHFNFRVFKNLLAECLGNYTSYIIMPAAFDNTGTLLSKFPRDRVFILDRLKPDLDGYPVVYQDFENDFFDALQAGTTILKKYRRLVFVHPGGKEPPERVRGFERYCKMNHIDHLVIKSVDESRPGLYEAWFLISDHDLVELVKTAKNYKYKLGKKFGIVSFNDTMLKEVVAGGITTISTDFAEMGKTLATMVLDCANRQIRNPSRLIVRKSL